MKSIIKQAERKISWELVTDVEKRKDENGNEYDFYLNKPLIYEKIEDEWNKVMYEFDERIGLQTCCYQKLFTIEEDGKEKEIFVNTVQFRPDLEAYVYKADYVYKETTIVTKEQAEAELENHLRKYNKQMFESNKELLQYCKVHNINIYTTDYEEMLEVYENIKKENKEEKQTGGLYAGHVDGLFVTEKNKEDECCF